MDSESQAAGKPTEADVMTEIRRMQAAHSVLARRMDTLAESLTSTSRLSMTLSASVVTANSTAAAKTKSTLLVFARRNATNALRDGHAEFSRNIPLSELCPGNSATQVVLKSKSSDATLADFRVLTAALTRSTSFNCESFPSDFYVMSLNAGACERVDLLFESYFDICEALCIPPDVREAGVYKEKYNPARQLRSVQVMGVDALEHGSSPSRARRILLGRSDPSAYSEGKVHVLYQRTMSWSDNSCDAGFEHREDELCNIAQTTTTSQPYARQSARRTSNINRAPGRTVFRLTWTRHKDSPCYAHVPAAEVSGSICSFFPAVVMSPRVLTTSAQTIFATPIRNQYLKQLLVSRETSRQARIFDRINRPQDDVTSGYE